MEIHIFKTDINSRWHVLMAGNIMKNLQGILKWNVDVEDVDHVLRVEATDIPPVAIEQVFTRAGYYCEEMRD